MDPDFSVSRSGERALVALGVVVAGSALLVSDHLHTPFDSTFDMVAAERMLPAALLRAIARKESGFKPGLVSPPNANGTHDIGLMQVNERTGTHYGYGSDELKDPVTNVRVAGLYLNDLKLELGEKLNAYTWVSAYNAGSPGVLRHGIFNAAYVAEVIYHWQLYALARVFG